jgi:hypothetical protein
MLDNVPADQYLVVRQGTPPPGTNEQPLRSRSGGENRRGMD